MHMVPVFDCFTYFMERELLEFRIRLLKDHVSGFIISESDHTFSGDAKPFTCVQTLKDLGLWTDQIQVIECALPDKHECADPWVRERAQRNALAQQFKPHAVHIVSDCDEIINPELIQMYAHGALQHVNSIVRIHMAWLNARVTLRVCDPLGKPAQFSHAFMCLPHHVHNHTLSEIREDEACEKRQLPFPSLYLYDAHGAHVDAGWHMSWLGGTSRMKTKMQSYSHYKDGHVGIFETAVGAINSEALISYLNTYDPQPGSLDPYGRSDYHLKSYPVSELPTLITQLDHLHEYFFGATT